MIQVQGWPPVLSAHPRSLRRAGCWLACCGSESLPRELREACRHRTGARSSANRRMGFGSAASTTAPASPAFVVAPRVTSSPRAPPTRRRCCQRVRLCGDREVGSPRWPEPLHVEILPLGARQLDAVGAGVRSTVAPLPSGALDLAPARSRSQRSPLAEDRIATAELRAGRLTVALGLRSSSQSWAGLTTEM
jgi:hypothetical protein